MHENKDKDKNKESLYLQCWDVKIFYAWAMLQKLSKNNFECIEDASQFNEVFIKRKKVMKNIFLKLMFNILKKYLKFIIFYHFHLKE